MPVLPAEAASILRPIVGGQASCQANRSSGHFDKPRHKTEQKDQTDCIAGSGVARIFYSILERIRNLASPTFVRIIRAGNSSCRLLYIKIRHVDNSWLKRSIGVRVASDN
jgi:hypothetical protein